METRVVTTHLPLEMADRLDDYAARLERSRGWIVKQAVRDWIEWEEEKNRLTREAQADVRAGNFIEHEDIVAWAQSLGTDDPLPPPQPRKHQ